MAVRPLSRGDAESHKDEVARPRHDLGPPGDPLDGEVTPARPGNPAAANRIDPPGGGSARFRTCRGPS